MGYTLKSSSTSVLEVEPILGREENGVMASLERKIQAQEKAGRKALLAPARKVPQGAVKAVVDESTDRLDKSLAELSHEMLDTVKQSEFSRYDSNLQARLWGSQGEFNDITAQFQEKQEQINSAVTTAQQAISENIELNRQLGLANEKANEANRRATEAVRVAQESISRDMSRDIFANRDESVWDSFLRIDMPKLSRTIRLMAKGEWTGVVILSVQYSSGDLHRELVHIGEERFYNVKIPLGDVANALASYQVRTGTDYGQGESDN